MTNKQERMKQIEGDMTEKTLSAYRQLGPTRYRETSGLYYEDFEIGVANLKGLSSTERAQALIALAHPAFKEELTAAAKDMHLI